MAFYCEDTQPLFLNQYNSSQQPEKPVEHYQIFPSTELNSSQVTDSHSVDVETLRRKSVESPARWGNDDVKDKHSYEHNADHHHGISALVKLKSGGGQVTLCHVLTFSNLI